MTTSTLRPNATTIAGSVTYTGGANWTAVTADDSDATYATLSSTTGATLELTTFTIPAGNVTKQARIRARMRSESSTTGYVIGVGGWPLEASRPGLQSSSNATTTITTFTGSYVPASLSQTEIDGLQILVAAPYAISVRFVELYLDIVHAAQPTVALTNPTGTVTTSSPSAAWSYTQGSDGGPQTHYQVKVFTSAVVAGGGFSPDTSTSIYDSGEVASSTTTASPGPIADGTNHGYYIRVAQTINGSKHWSAWDSNTVTVDTNGPGVTSITASATSTTGLITVTVNRDTGGAAWDAVTVERSEDSGTTWLPVRGATEATETNTFATFAANTFTVLDYEAPNGTSVTYRARGNLTTVVGDWSSSSTPTSWSSTSVFLKSVTTPSRNQTVTVTGVPEYALSETRTQSMQIQTTTANAASSLETLLGPIRRVGVFHVLGAEYPTIVTDNGDVLLLQFPSAAGITDQYLTVTSYSRAFVAPARAQKSGNLVYRLFQVDAVVVDEPADTSST